MSFMLPDVDLSTAMVGSQGRIPLQTMGVGAGGVSANPSLVKNPPTLYIHNDSGCGLGMTLKDSGTSFNLPAGAWVPVPIGAGESELDYVVKYILPNAPVNLLMIAYYAPGEAIPQTSTLGNSPVGIGGSTNNVTNTSLSNEGNAANTLVVDIGDATLAQLWKVWTDHFSISVDQSNVAHTVLQGKTAGNPLQLGQAGDITEVLGSLIVDSVLSVGGKVTTVTGGVSGTATLYEVLTGTIKLSVIYFNNFKTGASAQPITFSTPYTAIAKVWVGGISANSQFRSGTTVRDLDVITGLGSGGGTTNNQTTISSDSFATINEGFDNVLIPANNITAHTSLAVFIGV